MKDLTNVIETIRTDKNIDNKTKAYLEACSQFEIEASKIENPKSMISRKSSEEVSISFDKAKKADCEFNVYSHAHATEKWFVKLL